MLPKFLYPATLESLHRFRDHDLWVKPDIRIHRRGQGKTTLSLIIDVTYDCIPLVTVSITTDHRICHYSKRDGAFQMFGRGLMNLLFIYVLLWKYLLLKIGH